MARHASSAPSVSRAVEGLVHSIRALVESVGTAAAQAVQVGKDAKVVKGAVVGKQRGPGKGNPKLKAALKKSWANYTPAERKARIAAMLKGRGLKPKGAGAGKTKAKRVAKLKPAMKRASRVKPSKNRKPGGTWASMTSEQRAERVARMQAGRSRRASRSVPKPVAVSAPAREASLLND